MNIYIYMDKKLCKDASVSISNYDRHFTEQEIHDLNRISKIRSGIMRPIVIRANTDNISYIAKDKDLPAYELNLLLETKIQLGQLGTGKQLKKKIDQDNTDKKKSSKKEQRNSSKGRKNLKKNEDENEDEEKNRYLSNLKLLYDDDTWEAKFLRKFIYDRILCKSFSKPILDKILLNIHPGNVEWINPNLEEPNGKQRGFMSSIDIKTPEFEELVKKIKEILKSRNFSFLKKKINELCKNLFTIPGHNVAILYFISLYLLIEIYLIKYSLNFTFQELFPNYLNDLANLALDDPDNWLDDRLERYRGHLQFIDLNLTDKNETDSVERKFKNVLDTVYNFDEDNKKILKDFLKKKIDQIDQDNTDEKKKRRRS